MIEYFRLPNGREPFREWFGSQSIAVRHRVRAYLDRLTSEGTKKNLKSIGDGILELKLTFGGGIRIYLVMNHDTTVLLLGGNKGTQNSDIRKVKEWKKLYVSK